MPVLARCFGELDLVKIEAEVFAANVRSIRLVESVGMRCEYTIRSLHRRRGVWVDVHNYGLLPDEVKHALHHHVVK